jgi:hypothetical protein
MYVYSDQLKKIKGNPYTIGGVQTKGSKEFSLNSIAWQEGLKLYFLTDGFCDQSGGQNNKCSHPQDLRTGKELYSSVMMCWYVGFAVNNWNLNFSTTIF